MNQTAIVDGMEVYASLTSCGKAVKCDKCGFEYNGGNGVTKAGPIRTYRRGQVDALVFDARRLGWVIDMEDEHAVDLCPACAAKDHLHAPITMHDVQQGGVLHLKYKHNDDFHPLIQQHRVKIEGDVELQLSGFPPAKEVPRGFPTPMLMLVVDVSSMASLKWPKGLMWRGGIAPIPFLANTLAILTFTSLDGEVIYAELSARDIA